MTYLLGVFHLSDPSVVSQLHCDHGDAVQLVDLVKLREPGGMGDHHAPGSSTGGPSALGDLKHWAKPWQQQAQCAPVQGHGSPFKQ